MRTLKKKSVTCVSLGQCETLENRQLLAAQWSDTISNPYFPLLQGTQWVYKGSVDGKAESEYTTVTNATKIIDGVKTTVVVDHVFLKGKLAEKNYDYYAQDNAGNVWFFGEDASQYINGKVVSRAGSFHAGVNGAKSGIIMFAHPGVGDAYSQDSAKGVAEDRALVLSRTAHAATPFAICDSCLETREYDLLDPGAADHKFYAPGTGLLHSNDVSGGTEVLDLVSFQLAPAAYGTRIYNPYFPLTPGTTQVFEGTLDGSPETVRTAVTHQTKLIAGVKTTVVLDQVFVNGKLKENTYDYYAQDKIGNVWYFGENTAEFQSDGTVNTDGSFLAGVNGAKSGIIMPAYPNKGFAYFEEMATGVAEDQARVTTTGQKVVTPFATFGNCIVTQNFTALEPGALEEKYYAPGFGPVFSQDLKGGQDILKLVAIEFEK